MKDYKVGYAKPPKEKQFKEGESGNPKGRSKGSKSMHTLLNQVLNQKIVVNQNGVPIKISKKIAILFQLVNKAAKGDMRAIQTALPYALEADIKEEEHQKVIANLTKDEQFIFDDFVKKCSNNG